MDSARSRREALIEDTLGVMRAAMGRALSGVSLPGAREGFPILQHFALHYIMNDRGITQSELANLLGVSPGYVTTLVDRMEADRLVQRVPDRRDRRRIRLRITLRGHHFHHELHRDFGQASLPIFEGWTEEEIAAFQAFLRKLAMPIAGGRKLTDPAIERPARSSDP